MKLKWKVNFSGGVPQEARADSRTASESCVWVRASPFGGPCEAIGKVALTWRFGVARRRYEGDCGAGEPGCQLDAGCDGVK